MRIVRCYVVKRFQPSCHSVQTGRVSYRRDHGDLEHDSQHSNLDGSSKQSQASNEKPESFIITWDGPNDPGNPRNWSTRRRWTITVVVSLFTFIRYAHYSSGLSYPSITSVPALSDLPSLLQRCPRLLMTSIFLRDLSSRICLSQYLSLHMPSGWVVYSVTLLFPFTILAFDLGSPFGAIWSPYNPTSIESLVPP